ncbi:MAG: glycosyltransferase [Limnospira sp.]
MNILHILQGFSLGGASRSVVAIAKDSHIKKRGQNHRTISLTPAQPEAVKLAEVAGMQVIQQPNLEPITSEIEWADIVHFHFWNSPELYEFLQLDLPEMRSLVWLKVVGDRSPHVVTKKLTDYSDILLATTPRTLDLPAIQSRPDLLQNNRIGVVPGIADFSRLASFKPRPHSTFNVGYIGTVDFSKLHQNYVPMSAGVEVPDIRFIVCGGGIENHLKQQANHLGVAEKFEFRGYVEDIRSVLEILDVFGYPLVEDTYATSEKSLQEAMYAGVPPVVFPHGGVKHLVIHDRTGLVVQSEREYREAIAYLYRNPEERMRLGNNAREYARQHFDPEVSIEKINQTYRQLMEFPKRKHYLNPGNRKTGAALFVESLGDADPQFKVSLTSDDLSEQLKSDRQIAVASPGLCNPGGGGLFHYRNYYPRDGYLRLWTGLILQRQGRYLEAIAEFKAAYQLGCDGGRVAGYLSQAAEKVDDRALAKQALKIARDAIPNWLELQDDLPVKPKVSAIVSTYNSEKFLRGCLADLTSQTLYKNGELEIIIIDSASEEKEGAIASDFQSQYPHIIYHRTEPRETLYAAWNRAIKLAKGDYITNANTDDRHRKDALAVMADYLDQNQNVAIVYGDQLITQNENETFDNTQANRRWDWPEFSYEELERRCILGPQPMWRKSLHEKYGCFRGEFQVAGDYEFWLRVGKTEKIVKLPQVFGLYYEHPQGLENSSPAMVQEVRQIWHEYGISQRGIQPTTSVPVPVSPSELDSMREGTPTTPQISIIIPCYNQANYLREAVDSLLAQTIADWECIIVNDGSSDGTPVVAELLIELHRDRALKLINQDNKGVVAARNLGLSQARGNYLLFLDADDKLHPNFLAETLEILQQKPDIGFVYTDIEYFGTQQGVKTDGDFDPSRLLRSNQASITSLFRRSICDRIGGFKTEMEAGLEDWEFWVAAYESGWRGYRLPKPYLYYRQYGDGSRLQNLLADRQTLAVQKAKIIALHPNLYTAEEVRQAAEILKERGIVIHPVRSTANIVSNPDQFLVEVTDLANRYNRGSGDRSLLDKLRQLRQELAEFWLNCDPQTLPNYYTGAAGKAHKLLLKSGIKHEVKTDSEIHHSQTIKRAIPHNYSHRTAIAAMLYFWPHQLSIAYEKLTFPQWLAGDYLDFLLSNPEFFQETGEADRYCQYFLEFLRYLHRSIFANPDSQNWKNIAWFFTTHCRVISLYFNTENLKEIYTLRGDIIEFALRSRGAQIDWEIPQRSPDRQRIRVGILNKHFGAMTETFATLPAFEYLDRGQFEVVLYALQTDGNSVEKYSRNRADKFVRLSGSLMQQVNTIRGDELDILLVGTNITAVTHEITLIACHRLARVQLTCFNSPVTTGFKNIDFYIAGELMELPKDGSEQYREKRVTIPGAGCCFSYTVEPQKTAAPPTRQQLGIPDDAIALISSANLYKLIPELRETWVKILAAVPHSVLVLLPFGASWTQQYPEVSFQQQMQALLNRYNIDPKRLKILKALPNRAQVKAVLQLGDIYLDSFPYAGTTSLVDPLEVGLPVVVWEGNTLRSRMGAAMVRSLLPNEPIPASEQAYIDVAVQLATDGGWRQQKSQEIREKMAANPEFLDSRDYATKMGGVFAQLFQLRRRQQEAVALDNPAVRQQFLAELVDRVNLYDLDPTNAEGVEKLRHTRRVMAEYWLNQPPEKLETLYQQPIGKGYQILLNRGIQKEPLADSEQVLVNQLAKAATGLKQPNSINCLMVVMLYCQPGKMLVRDALNRLPGWLYPDYQRIFENAEAIAQIQQVVTAQQQPKPQIAEELSPAAIQLDHSQFINRAIGCTKLFHIDPTDAGIATELRQLRWKMAHFWLNLPDEQLEKTYDRDMGDAYRSLLYSRLQQELLTQQEWDFLQNLAAYLRRGLEVPRSIHYLMAAMLYYRPEQIQIQNPSQLPARLRQDYEFWQNSTSEKSPTS